jgi:hypothetical protein
MENPTETVGRNEYMKNYYKNNKDKMLAKLNETVMCECGYEYRKGSGSHHRKTTKHINNAPTCCSVCGEFYIPKYIIKHQVSDEHKKHC